MFAGSSEPGAGWFSHHCRFDATKGSALVLFFFLKEGGLAFFNLGSCHAPTMMLGLSRNAVFALLGLLLIWTLYLGSYLDSGSTKSYFGFKSDVNQSPLSPHVHKFFDQVFSAERAPIYEFSGLKAACARSEWKEENKDVYFKCGGMCMFWRLFPPTLRGPTK